MIFWIPFCIFFGNLDFSYSGHSLTADEIRNIQLPKLKDVEPVINAKLTEIFKKIYNVYQKDSYYKSITVIHDKDLVNDVQQFAGEKWINKFQKDVEMNLFFFKNLNQYSIDLTSLYVVMQMKFLALSHSLSFGDCYIYYTYRLEDHSKAKECDTLRKYLYWWGNLELRDFVARFQFVLEELPDCPVCIENISSLLSISEKINIYQSPEIRELRGEKIKEECSKHSDAEKRGCFFKKLEENQTATLEPKMQKIGLFLSNIKWGKTLELELPEVTIDNSEVLFFKKEHKWESAGPLVRYLYETHPDQLSENKFDNYVRYSEYHSNVAHILRSIELQVHDLTFHVPEKTAKAIRPVEKMLKNSFVQVVLDNVSQSSDRMYCIVLTYDEISSALQYEVLSRDHSIAALSEKKLQDNDQEDKCRKEVGGSSEEEYFSATDEEYEDED